MSVIRMVPVAAMSLWLAGCQSLPQSQERAARAPAAAAGLSAERGSPIYSDMVYSVLAGDIASQRDDAAEAYKHYLYAARLGRRPELAEMATKAALIAKQNESARRAVDLWMELDPDNLPALQISALLYAQADDPDRAVADLRRLLERFEREGRKGYLELARLLARVNDDDLRLRLMRLLVADREKDPDALFALALVEVVAHHFDQGVVLTRRALALRPGWGEARVLLVRALDAQNRKQEARAALERFLADAPGDTKLRATYARLLVQQGELPLARTQFEALLKAIPDDGDALFALGIIELEQKRYEEAAVHLQRLFEMGAQRDDAAFYLGRIREAQGRSEEALKWYAEVEGGRRFEALVSTARIHAGQGRIARARELLQQMRSRMGAHVAQVDLVEAEILRDIKQFRPAMEVLTRALQREPDNAELLYTRALVAVNVDRIDILEQDLRRIIDQDPDHADALNALGYTLADQTDRYDEALGYIRRALALKPDSAAVLDSMGWVQYRLGNGAQALDYLRRAMEALPDAEIASHLGEVLWEQGEHQRARQVWRDALKREPGSDYILRVMKRYGQTP